MSIFPNGLFLSNPREIDELIFGGGGGGVDGGGGGGGGGARMMHLEANLVVSSRKVDSKVLRVAI